MAFFIEKLGGSSMSLSSFCPRECQPPHHAWRASRSKAYREDEPDITKFKHGVASDGEIEVIDVQGLGVEDIQTR